MIRRGMVLLELMISFLIGSIMATGLMISLAQMSKLQESLNTFTSVYGRVAIVQNQLERDVMSAFIPAQTEMIITSTEQKAPPKPLDKVFYGTSNEGGRLQLLTCITSSPLEVFLGVKNAKPKPRVARVVYRLVPDARRKHSFVLMRQEGTSTLYFDQYKEDATDQMRSFAIIDGIQNMVITYVSIEQPKKADDGTAQKLIYKRSTNWDSAVKKEPERKKEETPSGKAEQKEVAKKEQIKLPNQIECKLSLWDSSYQSVKTFTYTIPIAYKASEYEIPAEQEKKATQQEKEGTKESEKKEAE